MRLRHLIASKLPSYELSGEVEADESYFGEKICEKKYASNCICGFFLSSC